MATRSANRRSDVDLANHVRARLMLEALEVRRLLTVMPLYIDTAQSVITLTGTANTTPIQEQAAGSLAFHLQGQVQADLQPGSIQFLSASSIAATTQAGPFLPGNTPANLAGKTLIGPDPAFALVSNLAMAFSSSPRSIDGAGHFGVGALTINLTSGVFNYSVPNRSYSGVNSLGGYYQLDGSQVTATLSAVGADQHLVVPIDIVYTFTDSFLNTTFALEATGQIVADTIDPQAPVSNSDSYALNEDQILSVDTAGGVLSNDNDPQGNPIASFVGVRPQHGTLALKVDGSFTYTPAPNYFGTDSFTYRAFNGANFSPYATVTIAVAPVPDAPVVVDDLYRVDPGGSLVVAASQGTLANDSDADGDHLNAIINTPPAHGAFVPGSDGSFQYTPNAGYVGYDSFTYHANDGTLDSPLATVTMAVSPPPVAVDDQYVTNEDQPLVTIAPGVLANDHDSLGEPLTALVVTAPQHGTLVLQSNGSVQYTPLANYNGPDSFTYRVQNRFTQGNVAYVSLTVLPVDDPPVAHDDDYTIDEDSVLVVAAGQGPPGVLSNDSDPDSLGLSAVLASGPLHGVLDLHADGTFNYSPVANFNGTDTFTYNDHAGTLSAGPATVTIHVRPVNDLPTGVDDASTSPPNVTFNVPASIGVLANDQDLDGDVMSSLLISRPAHGSVTLNADGSFTYTPSVNFLGTDQFTYKTTDPSSGLTAYTVDLVNDTLVAIDTQSGVSRVVGAIGHDMFAADLAYFNGVIYAVTPNSADVFGQPGWTLVGIDPATGRQTSAAPITINGNPVLISESLTATAGKLYIGYSPNQLTTNSLGEINPATGVVTPVAAFGNNDFDGMATDPIGTLYAVDLELYSGAVKTLNFYRFALSPPSATYIGGPLLANSSLSDFAFSQSTAVGIDAGRRELLQFDPAHFPTYLGSISLGNSAANYDGIVFAPDFETNVHTVTIHVAGTGAAADQYSLNEDTTLNATTVLANDMSSLSGPLTAVLVQGPLHGGLTFNVDGTFSYSPVANYFGTDTFTYMAIASGVPSAPATVTLQVANVNDAPVASDDLFAVEPALGLNTAYRDRIVADGPLGYWRLGESAGATTAVDASGHGYNGTYVGGVTLAQTGALGKDNDGAAAFDGSTGYVNVGAVPAFNQLSNSFTIEAWIRKPAATDATIVNTFSSGFATGYSLMVLSNGALQFTTYGIKDYITAPTALVDNQWHHLAVAFDASSTARFYVDGNLVQAITGSSGARTNNVALNIGHRPNFAGLLWQGGLDEVAIYGRGLTAVEVQQHYLLGAGYAPLGNLLANDVDVDNDVLQQSVVTPTQHGQVKVTTDGTVYYRTDGSFAGSDTFIYRLSDGHSQSNLATVQIADTPSVAGIVGPDTVLRGQPVTFTLSASDVIYKQAAGYTYTIDWNGDGSDTETVSGLSGITVSHTFQRTGSNTVRVTATDLFGGVSAPATRTVAVTAVQLLPNAQNRDLTDLVWTGNGGSDSVAFDQIDATTIRVRTLAENGASTEVDEVITGVTGRVIATAGNGNDTLDASGLTAMQATLDGGAGSNTLFGGRAGDILIGGTNGGEGQPGGNTIIAGNGNNTIYGNAPVGAEGSTGGNNLIIGGTGNDTIFGTYQSVINTRTGLPSHGGEGGQNLIVGNGGSDTMYASQQDANAAEGGHGSILIAGTISLSPSALQSVLNEWKSADTVAVKMASITGTPSGLDLNGSNYLIPVTTVSHNGAIADTLFSDTAGKGNWLWYDFDVDAANRSKASDTTANLH